MNNKRLFPAPDGSAFFKSRAGAEAIFDRDGLFAVAWMTSSRTRTIALLDAGATPHGSSERKRFCEFLEADGSPTTICG
jgi:hypothetical protein